MTNMNTLPAEHQRVPTAFFVLVLSHDFSFTNAYRLSPDTEDNHLCGNTSGVEAGLINHTNKNRRW